MQQRFTKSIHGKTFVLRELQCVLHVVHPHVSTCEGSTPNRKDTMRHNINYLFDVERYNEGREVPVFYYLFDVYK